MPTPPKSLNALVPWSWLLDVLGVAVPSQILPAVVLRCPLCQHEQLTIVEDYLAGGEWFHCRNCKQSGDMIELAAKAWRLSIKATILKLSQLGFDLPTDPDTVHGYLTGHIEYRKRLRRLWRQARTYVDQNSTSLRPLLSKLRFPDGFSVEKWNAGPAKILGGELCQTIEQVLLPGSVVCCGNEQTPRCRSARRIFKGGNWKETLVLPFYAAPGQICAYGFIGREGNMPRDYVFRHANVSPFVTQPTREAGLAMHPDTQEMAVEWQHTVFAVSNPLVYLQLQLGQFQCSDLPLPLVLWQDLPDKPHVRTQFAWEMFGNCRVIFWDPSISLATLRQAIAIDGWIVTCGPRRDGAEELCDYLYRCLPTALCGQLQKHARPWPKALAKAMPKWTDSKIEDFFLQLQLDAPQIEKVRKACPLELQERLDSILKSQGMRRFIQFDNHTVVEQDDGWYCFRHGDWARQQELVCNAKLRLSQVITYKRTGQIVYVGTITFHGEEISFTAPQREIERNPFGWMQQFLLPKGLLRYNPAWNKRILRVATFFKDPKVVQGLEVVGWDQEKMAFLLPGHSIGLNGTRKQPTPKNISLLPAANLKYSSEPLPTNWPEMGNEYELSLFWGALAGVLGNVLAPALLTETKGIGLVGDGAREMGLAVAKAAGCLVCELGTGTMPREAAEEEHRHRWPLCVPVAEKATGFIRKLWNAHDGSHVRNCVTPLDEGNAEGKKIDGRWHLLTGMQPVKLNSRLLRIVSRLVPAYLRDVCARRLKVEDVLSDLANFVARQGGAVDVEKAREVLWVADDADLARPCERPRRKVVATAR